MQFLHKREHYFTCVDIPCHSQQTGENFSLPNLSVKALRWSNRLWVYWREAASWGVDNEKPVTFVSCAMRCDDSSYSTKLVREISACSTSLDRDTRAQGVFQKKIRSGHQRCHSVHCGLPPETRPQLQVEQHRVQHWGERRDLPLTIIDESVCGGIRCRTQELVLL